MKVYIFTKHFGELGGIYNYSVYSGLIAMESRNEIKHCVALFSIFFLLGMGYIKNLISVVLVSSAVLLKVGEHG
jgi:hypothetical protein